jgi:hypothetical protein
MTIGAMAPSTCFVRDECPTGEVLTDLQKAVPARTCCASSKQIDAAVPRDPHLRVVLDNLSAHSQTGDP